MHALSGKSSWPGESPYEGSLRKKSHHLGVWQRRYVRLEPAGEALQYWAAAPSTESTTPSSSSRERAPPATGAASGAGEGLLASCAARSWAGARGSEEARAKATPRGQIPLKGCYAFTSGEQRLAIRTTHRRFDEELEAKTSEERDEWIRRINSTALRLRTTGTTAARAASAPPGGGRAVGPALAETMLRSKGLWDSLLTSVVSPGTWRNIHDADGAWPCGSFGTQADLATRTSQALLAHVHCGPVLLRTKGAAPTPRQGRFVQLGRRVLRSSLQGGAGQAQGAGVEGAWLLLASSRPLFERSLWHRRRPVALEAAPPVALEVLSAYDDPRSDVGPFATLALGSCAPVGPTEECADGCGIELRLERLVASGSSGWPGYSDCSEDSSAAWTLVFETREEAEAWGRALAAARWAALAQAPGRSSASEEAYADFETDQASWSQTVSRRLADVACDVEPITPAVVTATPVPPGYVLSKAAVVARAVPAAYGPAEASAALQRVLCACEDVCREAEDVLSVALGRRPLSRSDCDVVVSTALEPTLLCLGKFWLRWHASLSQADSLPLLRWLAEHLATLSGLGVIFEPLRGMLERLTTELSLRTGARLRRMVEELLVQALKVDPGLEAAPTAPRRLDRAVSAGLAVVNLPVDLFTMVLSCFPRDLDHEGDRVFRESIQRVAKFIIHESQVVLEEWLFGTRDEVLRKHATNTSVAEHWCALVAGLASSMPAFARQCRELDAMPLRGQEDQDHRCQDDEFFGPEALPDEWSFSAEAIRFEAMQDAMLWVLCDVTTSRWRREALAGGQTFLPRGACAPSLADSVRALTNDPLQLLHRGLDKESFDVFLHKLFEVCLATYIVRAKWLAWNGPADMPLRSARLAASSPDARVSALLDDLPRLCSFFQDVASWNDTDSNGLPPWDAAAVQNLFRSEVMSSQPHLARRLPHDRNQRNGFVTPGVDAPNTETSVPRIATSIAMGAIGKLVEVLSDGPLPVLHLLEGTAAASLAATFEEIPTPLPPSGDCLGDLADQQLPMARTPSAGLNMRFTLFGRRISESQVALAHACFQSRAGGQPTTPRGSLPPSSPPMRRSNSGPALVRQSLSGPLARPDARTSSPRAPPPMMVVERRGSAPQRVRTAEEGGVCDLFVDEVGVYGLFCCVSMSTVEAADCTQASCTFAVYDADTPFDSLCATASGRDGTASPAGERRRWVQLARRSAIKPASLEVFRTMQGGSEALRSESFGTLLHVAFLGALLLRLAFRDSGGRVRLYKLRFDCPSNAFRWRRVLREWWAWGAAGAPATAERPVVALTSAAAVVGAVAWGEALPPRLDTGVLETRLGGLWRTVQPRLERASAEVSASSAAAAAGAMTGAAGGGTGISAALASA